MLRPKIEGFEIQPFPIIKRLSQLVLDSTKPDLIDQEKYLIDYLVRKSQHLIRKGDGKPELRENRQYKRVRLREIQKSKTKRKGKYNVGSNTFEDNTRILEPHK